MTACPGPEGNGLGTRKCRAASLEEVFTCCRSRLSAPDTSDAAVSSSQQLTSWAFCSPPGQPPSLPPSFLSGVTLEWIRAAGVVWVLLPGL